MLRIWRAGEEQAGTWRSGAGGRRTIPPLLAAMILCGAVTVFSVPVLAEQALPADVAEETGTAVVHITDDQAVLADKDSLADNGVIIGPDDASLPEDGDDVSEDALSEEERLRQQHLLQQAAALRAQLEELGNAHGTYDPVLIEAQQDLGRTYLELEQFNSAVDHLSQALQLVRVNEGLYSERQVAVLTQLIEAHQGRQDWEDADDYQHLLFGVQSRLHEAGTEAHADALIAFSGWRVQAARHNLLARGGAQYNVSLLQDMQEEQDRALEAARDRGHVRQQWDLLYTRALTDIELARQYNYRSLMDFAEPNEPRYVTRTVCRMVADGANGMRRVCWNQTVNNPDYYRAANDHRRSYIERARSRVQSSLRQLDELLAENPDFASEYEEDTERGLEAIQQVAADLQRDARRAAMRRW